MVGKKPIDEIPMARYEIEQYELHVSMYEVVATSVVDALRRLFNGDGDMSAGSEYIGVYEERGLRLADNPVLAEELRHLGIDLKGHFVQSICQVRHIANDVAPNE